MKKRLGVLLCLILGGFAIAFGVKQLNCASTINHVVNFEKSMGGPDFPEYKLMMTDAENERLFKKYEKVYYNRFAEEATSKECRIPKIIHFIWIGPKAPPSFFEGYKLSWQQHNPDWQIKVWGNEEAAAFPMDLREEFDSSTNWGEKSDILRAEILDQIGGIYVDVDFQCLKPFDECAEKYDFFAGLEPPHEGVNPKTFPRVTVCNALIGSCPKHPIIQMWKRLIREKWLPMAQEMPECKKRVLERTFYTFGDAVSVYIDDQKYKNIVFPATYLYPYTFSELSHGSTRKRKSLKSMVRSMLIALGLKQKPCFTSLQPETLAAHHWSGTWQKTSHELFNEIHERVLSVDQSLNQRISALEEQIKLLKQQKNEVAQEVLSKQ